MDDLKSKAAMNVIIVDDHELFRLGFRELLLKIPGIKTISQASDGNEVMSLLKKGSYQVIFMDVRMPHTNGIEATAKSLGPTFPQGGLVVMNSRSKNFLFFRWTNPKDLR